MKRIKSLDRLMALATQKKTVVWGPDFYGSFVTPKPAAFVIGWPARTIHTMIKSGRLFEYRKKVKP